MEKNENVKLTVSKEMLKELLIRFLFNSYPK